QAVHVTAVHEAGHAVMMLAVGGGFDQFIVEAIEISTRSWSACGFVSIYRDVFVPRESEVAVNLAGYAAQHVHGLLDREELEELWWTTFDEANEDSDPDFAKAKHACSWWWDAKTGTARAIKPRGYVERIWKRTIRYMRRPDVRRAVEHVASIASRRRVFVSNLREDMRQGWGNAATRSWPELPTRTVNDMRRVPVPRFGPRAPRPEPWLSPDGSAVYNPSTGDWVPVRGVKGAA
ncbi:MAG TPA: hypothetical protein VGM56_23125, partial [Byssovorax sp.]